MKTCIQVFRQGIRLMFNPLKSRTIRYDELHKKSDAEAIASDWVSIGNDMREAVAAYGRTESK